MQVDRGARLGPYEIVEPIGAGGMGEIYRARDTRLGREVAIKVLPSHLSGDPDLRERFDREARTISNLTHAHVCTLYDVGHQDGTDFLVMELLEGETLADRTDRGPLPLKDVIRYGAEIAEALDKAHKQGIVHRDLKPGNVMITKSGAKVLDFGLAKYATHDSRPETRDLLSHGGATVQKPLTQEGTLLGTIQYMAPEQLEGKDADPRTDIFALGALLYEMATGKRAFEGKSKASLIASIMGAEPAPISATQPMTPPALDRIVRACLEKDPDDRFQSAHDVARELRWIAEAVPTSEMASAPARRRYFAAVLAATALIAGAIGWLAARTTARQKAAETVRFTLEPPAGYTFRHIVISPDGRRIAYVLTDQDRRKSSIWVRSLSELQGRRLIDVDRVSPLFWSWDGTRVGFFVLGKLQTVHIDTASVQVICETSGNALQATWGSKGMIVFEDRGSLYRVSDRGGEAVMISKPAANDISYNLPSFLPDGERFLFFLRSEKRDRQGVYLGSIRDSSVKRLFGSDTTPGLTAYAGPGYLIHHRGDKLLAWKFREKRGEVEGDPIVLVDEVAPQMQRNQYSISHSGSLVYRTAPTPAVEQMVVLDRSGRETRTVGPKGPIWHAALSPDERLVTLEIMDPKLATTDLWLIDVETQVTSRLTFDPVFDWQPVWSHDGNRIYFASNRTDQSDVYSIPPAGGAEAKLVYGEKYMQAPMDISSDGKFLLVHDTSGNESIDVVAVPLSGGQPIPVARSSFDERCARFSPDGRWVAYDSNESGDRQVFLQSFPDAGRKWQISTAGGLSPAWRRDGRELYYLSTDAELMVVEMRGAGADLRPSAPKMLFRLDRSVATATLSRYVYAPVANGTAFYVRKQLAAPIDTAAHVVLNATAELE